jgi:hypothetical protein
MPGPIQTDAPLAQLNNAQQSKAMAAITVCALLVVTFPGALIGAAIAFMLWRFSRPDVATRWLIAGLFAATAAAFQPAVTHPWSWPLLVSLTQHNPSSVSVDAVLSSLPAEALFGPLILLAFQLGLDYRRQTIHGQEWGRHRDVERRKKALEHGWLGPRGGAATADAQAHPPGVIRLGVSADDELPFDLKADEVATHVFVPGASGTGKTTTLLRLADGALANGYGVVIIDCKGVGLGGDARVLASRRGVPFTVVDPQDDRSVGYDPCSGDAATIANKLIGAFTFGGDAEIYKQIAMEVIPVICRAMADAGMEITLDAIYDALGNGGLARLGRTRGAEKYRDRLEDMEAAGGIGAAGHVGLQKRLGALMEGTFGELFRKRPALDWQEEMSRPRITYVSLSSTAASEDVELFGRVVTNDLKQVCAQRMRAIERGEDPFPVLVIYDEFAALREARQIVDLLLQARQARCPLVVATQYLPEDAAIRKPVLSAGVLIAHRVEASDADVIASEFGTHTTTALTSQIDYDEGTTSKGSVRWVEEFNVHPNKLKELPVGIAAVYARKSQRRHVVRVQRTA